MVNGQRQRKPQRQQPKWGLLVGVFVVCILIWLFVLKKDGYYEDYGAYGDCSIKCNGKDSIQIRTRKYIPAKWGGKDIPENERKLEESKTCPHIPECVHGSMTDWVDDGLCSSQYIEEPGLIKQTRQYIPPLYGGNDVPEKDKLETERIQACYGTENRPIDGYFNAWIDDGICRKEKNKTSQIEPCSGGWMLQTREYIPPMAGGKHLPDKDTREQWIPCNGKESTKTKKGNCGDWFFSQCTKEGIVEFKRTYNKPETCGKDDDCKKQLTTRTPETNKTYYCALLKDISEDECPDEVGKDRKKTIIKNYVLPTRGKYGDKVLHDDFMKNTFSSNDWTKLYSLGINGTYSVSKDGKDDNGNTIQINYEFKRIDDGKTSGKMELEMKYTNSCPDILLEEEIIKNMWNDLCTKPLSDPIDDRMIVDYYGNAQTKIVDIRAKNEPDAKDIIDIYKIENLIKKQSNSNDFTNFIKSINDCYVYTNNKILDSKDFTNLKKNTNFRTNILYPGICYKGEYTITSPNGNFSLVCGGTRYNLALYHKSSTTTPIWSVPLSSGDFGNNNVCMYDDGDLAIYKKGFTNNIDSNGIWTANTKDKDHKGRDAKGSYCELLDNGLFIIKNKDGDINLSGKMEEIISSIAKGYYDLTKEYIHLKGGDEKYLKDSSKIYQYFRYSNDFTWTNGDYNLIIQSDGNFVLYKNSAIFGGSIKVIIWSTSSSGKSNAYIALQNDGHLLWYKSDGSRQTFDWKTNFYNQGYTPDIKLTNKGYLVICDDKKNFVKVYPDNLVERYLKEVHWEKSPRLLMMSYDNKIWSIKKTAFARNSNSGIYVNDKLNFDNAKVYYRTSNGHFQGWEIGEAYNDYDILGYKSIDYTNIEGYIEDPNGSIPSTECNSKNWCKKSDLTTFDNNASKRIFSGSGANAIPGYFRVSRNDDTDTTVPPNPTDTKTPSNGFIIYDKPADLDDIAWILFVQTNDKDAYAQDLIDNNKDLIKNILNDDGARDYMSDNIAGFGKDKWSSRWSNDQKIKYGISSFKNKSSFLNKIHKSLPFSTNGKLIETFSNNKIWFK
jgi:hypothetical protein